MNSNTYNSFKESQRRRRTAKNPIYTQIMKNGLNLDEEKAEIITKGLMSFSYMRNFARKTVFPEVIEYSETNLDIRSGYFCTFSDAYMLRKDGSLESDHSSAELTEDLLFGFDSVSNFFIRDLAESYRQDNDVKLSVEAWMQKYVKDDQERRSYKNILERGKFLTDAQMIKHWITVLGGNYERSHRKPDTDE